MVEAISGAGAAQMEMLIRAQQEIIQVLAVQQAVEQKLAAAAIRGNQGAQKAASGALVDVMA